MGDRALPVLFPGIRDQNWSCHSCGDCCRSLVGHLTLEERDAILAQGWRGKLGVEPVVRAGRSWVLNKRADGACVFLNEQNRCRIHAELGEAAKPLACRIFPFSVRPTPRGWQATLRFDCPSVINNTGNVLASHRSWLSSLVTELGVPDARQSPLRLSRRIVAQADESLAMERRFRRWFGDQSMRVPDRLIGAAKVVTLLSQARLDRVRGERFDELLQILFETARGESNALPGLPTARQRGMLRQVVMAHAEHVSLGQLRGGPWRRMRQKLGQLKRARQMLSGEGNAPLLPGFEVAATFGRVEEVRAAAEPDASRIENLLYRYLIARLEGQSVFGEGYYGWPMLEGFAALCLSVAAAGWLARYIAAAQQAEAVRFSDVGSALGIIDRAATRLPALGTWAERTRIAYLFMDEGLVRLLGAYRLTPA